MKYITILTVIVLSILYYSIGELLWLLKNPVVKRRAKRLVTGILIAALLAGQIDIMSLFMKTNAETSYAAETESSEIIKVSEFVGLPDDIKVQSIPVGSALYELKLPDTLEAVVVTDADTDTNTDANEGEDTDRNEDTDTDMEYIIEFTTLKADSLSRDSDEHSGDSRETEPSKIPETSQETITIENITWQSEPEYDGDTEGEYIFTTVLPEGYVLTNWVNTFQITVTVGGTDNIALLSDDGIMAVEADFEGAGTEDDPYRISTEAQLRKLADDVNSGEDYYGTYFKMTQDITLHEEWIPIGYEDDFSGIFDGGNHKIEGLTIMSGDSSWWYCGLFGEVWEGTVQNLTVKGDINSTVGATGGIVGRADEAKIINCSYEGTIISSYPGWLGIGGIAGEVYGGTKIINCQNKGDIKGSSDSWVYVGGIVGYASGDDDGASEIINCKNEGSVNAYGGSDRHAGGIAGWTLSAVTITDCRNTGSISAQDSYAGGIVGLAEVVVGEHPTWHDFSHCITTITNCLNENEVQNSPFWGEIVGEVRREDGTDLITIKNCYYKSGSGEAVGSGTENVDVKHVEGKSAEQFKSGEVAYLLQNPEQVDPSYAPQDGLVWGQNLGVDDFPGLVYFMEGDKEAKRVLRIMLYDADATEYTPYETYINNSATIKAAYGFEQISSQEQYPAETYETVGVSSGDGTGDIFREDTPITEDNTVLYLFYKEKFSGNNGTITTSPGTEKTQDLDEQMEYAGDTSAAGNFTYEIADGNDKLGASLSDSILTIPAAAGIGSYTLTIKATEKNPTVKNLQKQEGVTIGSKDSVTFEVTVTVGESDQDWIDEAIKVIQKALDEMNVTNETTKEDVQDAIDAALREAGLEDVTAAVGDDFNIEKATEESEGRITGKVTLKKGEATGGTEIHKKIGKQASSSGSGSNTSSSTQTGTDTTDDTQADVQTGTGTRNGRGNSTGTNRAGATSSTSTDNQSSSQSASEDETANSTAGASSETGEDAGQSNASGTDGQTTGSTAQTVKAELKDGKITVEGDVVVTGTVRTAETTTMTLTVGEGAVIVTVVSDEYKGNAGVADTVAVANAVLTPEQIQRVNDGETIEIRVDVKDISSQVSQQDRDIIEGGLADHKTAGDMDGQEQGELTLGAYIDISMYIRIGEGDWDAITQSGELIEIVIGIPDDLLSDERTYYIARSHEGDFVLLNDLDSEPDNITIKTELFSTYAIVYHQTLGVDTAGSRCSLCHTCSTFLGICYFVWLAIILVVACVVFFVICRMRKKRN